MRASKNYIVAKATLARQGNLTNTASALGYEGIFKTVLVLNTIQTNNNKIFSYAGSGKPIHLYGSDQMGVTTIAGFPLLTNTADKRFIRLMRVEDPATAFWLSTEIVSSIYFSMRGAQNNSDLAACTPSAAGDAGNFLSGSYGDLSYSYHQDCWGTNTN